jgi:hypothetical protein
VANAWAYLSRPLLASAWYLGTLCQNRALRLRGRHALVWPAGHASLHCSTQGRMIPWGVMCQKRPLPVHGALCPCTAFGVPGYSLQYYIHGGVLPACVVCIYTSMACLSVVLRLTGDRCMLLCSPCIETTAESMGGGRHCVGSLSCCYRKQARPHGVWRVNRQSFCGCPWQPRFSGSLAPWQSKGSVWQELACLAAIYGLLSS